MFSSKSGCRWACYEWKLGRIIYMENEIIRIAILVDKGTDIVEFLYKPVDIDFMWRSPFPLYRQGFPETIHGKLGKFIDYYPGGWQECFPNAGRPCEYKGADLGLHGEVSTLPWEYEIIESTSKTIKIKFSVRTLRTPFLLEKTLKLRSGSPALEIYEEVTNQAGEEMDFLWGHHPAFGEPFINENCRINIKGAKVEVLPGDGVSFTDLKQTTGIWPEVEGINGKPVNLSKIPSPDAKVSDVIFLSELAEGKYEIINPRISLGFRFEFPEKIFKYIWFWRVARGSFGYPWYGRTYNIALEPFSGKAILSQAVKNGYQLTLGPGKTLSAELSVTAFQI
ncbi:MAG: aldose 1-epimerase [Candidatus Omnitrophica bacterium]|nr:aldose 1-epimerase [Candidatus Omnitrophota bacterium]MCM8827975.1 aldose 1-epimerase [Candidatus Omnitrophota bacterium]